jgi:hypothetical protein
MKKEPHFAALLFLEAAAGYLSLCQQSRASEAPPAIG